MKAFRLADNKVSELSTWDNEALKQELDKIEDSFTGFSEENLGQLYFEEIEYKEREEREKETMMTVKFESPEDFKKLEKDLYDLISEKYSRVRVVVSSGEV